MKFKGMLNIAEKIRMSVKLHFPFRKQPIALLYLINWEKSTKQKGT